MTIRYTLVDASTGYKRHYLLTVELRGLVTTTNNDVVMMVVNIINPGSKRCKHMTFTRIKSVVLGHCRRASGNRRGFRQIGNQWSP